MGNRDEEFNGLLKMEPLRVYENGDFKLYAGGSSKSNEFMGVWETNLQWTCGTLNSSIGSKR